LLCIAAIFAVFSYTLVNYTEIQNRDRYNDDTMQVYARCEADKWANISIRTPIEDVQNIQCISLNHGMFTESGLVLGDLSKGSNDICSFEAKEKIDFPPRFEIKYNNGQTIRTACESGWILDLRD